MKFWCIPSAPQGQNKTAAACLQIPRNARNSIITHAQNNIRFFLISLSRIRKKCRCNFVSPQFYVHINVELFLNAFMCWRKKRSLIELSNHISERRCELKANKRAGILWIRYWLDGAARQLVANPDYTILLISYLNLL